MTLYNLIYMSLYAITFPSSFAGFLLELNVLEVQVRQSFQLPNVLAGPRSRDSLLEILQRMNNF